MAKFTQDIPPIRVLILDAANGTTVKTRFDYYACFAFFKSLGCHIEEANSYTASASDQVFRDQWDLIVVPYIGNTSADFPQLTTTLGRFDKADIPVYIGDVINVGGSGNARTFTGVTAYDSTSQKITATGIENWEGRTPGNVTFYCKPATAWDSTVTPHLRDASDNLCLFSKLSGSHNMLMQVGYDSLVATIVKPWYGAQWMVDQCPDATRKAQLKKKVKKRYILMRWDALGQADDTTSLAAGHFDTAYNTLLSYGVSEIWLAAYWPNSGSVDTEITATSTTAPPWFLARDRSNGGLFRCMNHQTDVVNGDTGLATDSCTSDGVLADQFKAASVNYETHCGKITDYGFTLGTDGFGKGIPNVQNGNDMNNPAAHFLTDKDGVYDTDGFYGGYEVAALWISGDEDYPTGATLPVSIRAPIKWAYGTTLLGYSEDGIDDSSATELPTLWNADIVRCAINGGGIYYHGGANFFLYQHADEFGQLFTTCPDILASGPWEDMLESLKSGNSFWFDANL